MAEQSEQLRFDALRLLRDQSYENSLTVFDYLVREVSNAHDLVWLGLLRLLVGDYRGAAHDFGNAVSQMPDDLSSHHHLAAIRASCPIDELRNGEDALKHANTVARIRPTHTWRSLSVLGACHAELGDFEIAASTTRQAIAISHADYRGRLLSRIEEYEKRVPYRISLDDLRAAVELREHRCSECDKLDFVIWANTTTGYKPCCLECSRTAE